MPLSPKAKRDLAAKAHHLNPCVNIGQKGLTDAVIQEVNLALTAHELIKVKAYEEDRALILSWASTLSTQLNAEFIKRIGRVLIFYRKNDD